METTEQFIARGGRVETIPAGIGKKETPGKGRQGEQLRVKLDAEAQRHRDLVARRVGAGKC